MSVTRYPVRSKPNGYGIGVLKPKTDTEPTGVRTNCDMVLLCNDPRAQDTLLEGMERRPVVPTLAKRLEKIRGKGISTVALKANAAQLREVQTDRAWLQATPAALRFSDGTKRRAPRRRP